MGRRHRHRRRKGNKNKGKNIVASGSYQDLKPRKKIKKINTNTVDISVLFPVLGIKHM